MNYISEPQSPHPESISLINECAKAFSPDVPALAEWHKNYGMNHGQRLAFDIDILQKFVRRNCAVLDVGSAPFIFTLAASRSGYNVTGCDLEPGRYEKFLESSRLKIVKCNVETEALPFPDEIFDAVVFNELFEHLRINPIFTLRQVLRVLKPAGTLMLSTPNLRSLNGILNFLLRNRAYSCCTDPYEEYTKLDRLGHMGHVREYTTAEVSCFLERIGFTITDMIYRADYFTTPKRALTRFFPILRPFVSYIGRKPPEQNSAA